MKNLKRFLAGITAIAAIMTASVSCSSSDSNSENSNSNNPESETSANTENPEVQKNADISGQTIYWAADYDINPSENAERSAALALFEDVYGGHVEYVPTNNLSETLLSGAQVDMVSYEYDSLPNGVSKNYYQPLDNYYGILEMDSDLWSNMTGVIDMFAYKDSHYVIPYSLSDPLVLIYSRAKIKELELDDPYELYQQGAWDWDAMLNMMEAFVYGESGSEEGGEEADSESKTKSDENLYGICGRFGQAMLQSTGHSVVKYENGALSNNISDPEIEKAEIFMQELAKKELYNPEWTEYFPNDNSTLFFAASDWALGRSNAENPEADLMVVPFPKAKGADSDYITCNFNAKLLTSNSDKGEAVATYIKCERLAAVDEAYKAAAKTEATAEVKSFSGETKSVVTAEQYDAVSSFLDPTSITPVFDFGYGMGERMYGYGLGTYETRGVMNNLEQILLNGSSAADSWETLRNAMNGIVTEEITKLGA